MVKKKNIPSHQQYLGVHSRILFELIALIFFGKPMILKRSTSDYKR